MYFDTSEQSEQAKEDYRKLFKHLKDVKRAGVIELRAGDTIAVPHTYFKVLLRLLSFQY